MTRAEALEEMKKPLYQPDDLRNETEYVLKKFGLSEQEFQEIMKSEPRPHGDFKSDLKWKKVYMDLLVKTSSFRKFFKKAS
jgi:hypothetical protein